jgi:hypothetical protein
MSATTKRRIAAGLSAAAISAVGFGLAGATAAGAAGANAAGGRTVTHATPAAATPGTYELFINFGTGFTDEGQLYLNSNASWSSQAFIDGGTWSTVGPTIGMSDFNAGDPHDASWGAKVSATSLGSAASPGFEIAPGTAVPTFHWYATFISASVPAHAAHSASRPVNGTAGRASPAKAIFPGTYNVFVANGNTAQFFFNSDSTWSTSSGFCNSGSFLSFKVKVGTKIIWTDIQADQGCGVDQLWMAKEVGNTKLGTPTHQGILATAGSGVFNTWYAIFA